MPRDYSLPWGRRGTAIVVSMVACLLRLGPIRFESWDYIYATSHWYARLQAQGWRAFSTDFSNYPPLYLYCLYLTSIVAPSVPAVAAIKLPSIVADLICAGLAYRIVELKYGRHSPWPLVAFGGVVLAPSVVLNSSVWGQADSLFTAGLVACLYFLLIQCYASAILAFSLALTLKLQAVFFIPFLLILSLKRLMPWSYWLIPPLMYLATIVPAWLTGRSFTELLMVYAMQVQLYEALTLSAPNLYTWFPPDLYALIYPIGLVAGLGVCCLFVVAVSRSRVALTAPLMIELALVSVLLAPYVLPKMHERYFYPADVIAIIWGAYFPRYLFVPLVINLVSTLAYVPVLFGWTIVSLPVLAFLLLGVLVLTVRKMLLTLYPV